MSIDQVLGKYVRLSRELADASEMPEHSQVGILQRMEAELVEVELILFGSKHPDEQTEDLVPGIGMLVAAAALRR
jgi:hypothetical protein